VIRLALPKGRNLEVALAAFRAAGLFSGLDLAGRSLLVPLAEEGIEALSIKDWDIPVYVEHGVADFGIVGSDVLAEIDGDLLVPVRLREGRSRMSLIGRAAALPEPGSQVRLATKYPNTARKVLEGRPWGAEIVKLSGSIELAPLLHLAEVALDIVQTGRTLVENNLVEIETVAEVAACLVVNRASYQRHRTLLNEWIGRLEAAEVAA
jgi:ATP phosphoribosyltransferase